MNLLKKIINTKLLLIFLGMFLMTNLITFGSENKSKSQKQDTRTEELFRLYDTCIVNR